MSLSLLIKDNIKPTPSQNKLLKDYIDAKNKYSDIIDVSHHRIHSRAKKLIESIEETMSLIDNDSLFDQSERIDDITALDYPHLKERESLQSDLNDLKLQRWHNFFHHVSLATKLLSSNHEDEDTLILEMNLLIQANALINQSIKGTEINLTYYDLCHTSISDTIHFHEKNLTSKLSENNNRYENWKEVQKNVAIAVAVFILITVMVLSGGLVAPIVAAGVIGCLLLLQTINACIALGKMMKHYDENNRIRDEHHKKAPDLTLQKNTLFVSRNTKKIESNYQALETRKKQL